MPMFYNPKEKIAFKLAKKYGIFSENCNENESITKGELCEVFAYLCSNFNSIQYVPDNKLTFEGLSNDHPMSIAFHQCVFYGLIENPESFASKIDKNTTSQDLRMMVGRYCKNNNIEYDIDQVINNVNRNYYTDQWFYNPDKVYLTSGTIAMIIIDIVKLYVKAVIQQFDLLASQQKYPECIDLLKECINMKKLFPLPFQHYFYIMQAYYPLELHLKLHIEIQKIFEKYFGYINDGNQIFSDPIYHYTSLSILEKVTGGSPLRLSNAINLNDPAEGKALFDLLNSQELNLHSLGITSPLKPNPSKYYIISFNANVEDDIPMWQQYGAECKGCRMAYCLDQFQEYPIYRVTYDCNIIIQFVNDLIAYHQRLLENNTLNAFNHASFEALIINILNQAAFLYKDRAYQHENEVRVIQYLDPSDAIEGDIREGEYFPRLYTELPAEMELDSVLLGPKVSDYLMDHIKLGIQARGLCYNMEKSIEDRVTRSKIKIR